MINQFITNVNTDKALTTILSRFDTNYVLDAVRSNLDSKWRPYGTFAPSVDAYENNFKKLLADENTTSDQREDILRVRQQTYEEILNLVCTYYNLGYQCDENRDIYTYLFFIYKYFVSDFTNTLINFYTNFIYYEKDQLYDYLNMDQFKDKTSAVEYSKNLCTDPKLILLHANIGYVLTQLSECPYDLPLLISYAINLDNQVAANMMSTILIDNGSVIKDYFAPYIVNPITRDDVITNIKLAIMRKFAIDNTQPQ